MNLQTYRFGPFAKTLITVWLSYLSLGPAAVFAQAPYYQGKTITIVQGREPGGTGDMRARSVFSFLRKYIPGQPTIITEFMPGGGGRKAANHIFRGAAADGLVIGNVGAGLIANAVLGETGVQYDLDKFAYLGTPNSASHYVFLSRQEAGFSSLEKLRAAAGVRIGAQTVGHDIYINGRLFAWLLGLKEPRFVTGYSGPEVDAALLRGEVDARANIADTIVHRTPEWIEKRLVNFHSIIEIPKGDKHPRFANLPEIETFAKSDRERKIVVLNRAFRLGGSPYIVPPGTPKERVEILREAMRKVYNDPEFHKEFKKLTGDDPTPVMPETLEKYIRELPRDPETIELFKKLAGAEPLPAR
jgi:tripartite-type tricarboxylate transporter receptor subunit TctC